MILYEVSVRLSAQSDAELSQHFEHYMRNKHIPEIWETGCFQQIHFDRAESGGYRTCYQAATFADYQRYLDIHAEALRADFMQHFPEGCQVSRLVLETLESWK